MIGRISQVFPIVPCSGLAWTAQPQKVCLQVQCGQRVSVLQLHKFRCDKTWLPVCHRYNGHCCRGLARWSRTDKSRCQAPEDRPMAWNP